MPKSQPNPEDQLPDPGDIAAFAHSTNIDKRQCRRTVPMRVLALGVSRTGTCSLRQALVDLGYKDCYHYSVPLQENPKDQDMWIEAYEAKFNGNGKPFTRADWDQLLGNCQAVTDTPCALFYKELLAAYPDAKVVLTIRDSPDQWFKSIMETVIPYVIALCNPEVAVSTRIYRWFAPIDNRFYKFINLQLKSPMFKMLMDDYRNGTQNAKQWYSNYIEELKSLVPKDRLLVMNVKEGWKPLCEFLGEEVPLYPFPRKNDTVSFQQNTDVFGGVMDQAVKWNMLKTGGAVLAVLTAMTMSAHRYGLLQKIGV